MKTALSLFAVATLLVVPTLSASQAATAVDRPAGLPSIQESDGEFSPDVQAYIARGDDLSGQLRFGAAALEYARAAEVARREGHLASGTSWRLANAQYYDGNLLGAATALDRLANEAGLVGDLEVEAMALYYAAWLNGKAGRKVETAARVARLEGLLRSRYMPVALRDLLGDWLKTSKAVAVSLP
jgi:hypothetical protein